MASAQTPETTLQTTPQEFHFHIDTKDASPVESLAGITGLPRQRIKQAMQKGAVWLTRGNHTRRIRRITRKLDVGDTLHLYYDAKVLDSTPATPLLISDLDSYSVWLKPRGMFSQGSKWGDHCAINRWVEQNLTPQRAAFIVHRLDRATSGLMLIAHRKGAASSLAKLFEKRQISKRYRALVHGHFASEQNPLTINQEIDGRAAHSLIRFLGYDKQKDISLLEIAIHSGRKHQVRRHLAHIGHPIVGDRLYGSNNHDTDLQLSACHLAFHCPLTGKQQEFNLTEELLPRLHQLDLP